MRIHRLPAVLLITTLAGAAAAQCSSDGPTARQQHAARVVNASYSAEADIVETARQAGSFNTLLAAAKAAGLADALAGEGPLTVFAPTDDAFAKLPAGTVESLLKPENKAKLAAILKYHVVPGALNASRVTRMTSAPTLNGQRISINASANAVSIDGARVVKADIACSNGVIHVIDSVILPEQRSIVAVAAETGSFSTLLAAAKAAGLADALAADGELTVLAPTDEAFAKLPAGTVETLLKPENKAKLAAILKLHVIPGRVNAASAVGAGVAETLNGQAVVFDIAGGQLRVNGADIVATDIDASNGVIHVIDSVILPD